MCHKVISEEPLLLKYCLNRHKTQEMRDKAVDANLPTLKFVPDWFVTNKILEKLDDVAVCNDDIDLVDIDSRIVKFFSDDMGLLTKDLNNINLDDDDNFGHDHPETIIHVRFMAWCNGYKQRKACQKFRWRINA